MSQPETKHPTLPPANGDKWPMASPVKTSVPSLPPDQSWPKISIVTPSFNQGKFLEKAIRSVLLQGYPNLEYLIIDGGSTDDSVEIIKKYEQHLTYWVSEKDEGQSQAINKGFNKATGEILGWLNSDDYFLEGGLEQVAMAYNGNPGAGAFFGGGEMFFEATGEAKYYPPYHLSIDRLCDAVLDKHIMQPSCFFTQRAWLEAGPLDVSLHFAMDLDLWFKIQKRFNIVSIDKNISVSLVHQMAKTSAYAADSYADAALVVYRNGGAQKARSLLVNLLRPLLEKQILADRLTQMENSWSWKITRPLRTVGKIKDFLKGKSDRKVQL